MPIWLIIILRSLLLFGITFVLIRCLGHKQPSRLHAFHYLNIGVLGIIAALISVGIIGNLVLGLLALAVWGLLPLALDFAALKSQWVHDLLNGTETVLIEQGKVMEGNLFRVRLTGAELLRELRSKNFFNVSDVEFAVLETTGEINVLPKADCKPVTPHDLGQKVAPRTEARTVILDGNILDEPLAGMGLNRDWLKLELGRLDVALTNVFLGQADDSGDLYLDLFDDALALPQPKVKELLHANLAKIQADLTAFALETEAPQAKARYARDAAALETVLKQLEPYLLR